jgi:hypothetical protein
MSSHDERAFLTSTTLAKHKVIRSKELSEVSSSDGIHGAGFQISTLLQLSFMSQPMRFTAPIKRNSPAEVCRLAWDIFHGMQKTSEDFECLRFEVWAIAISLDSLNSVETTTSLVDGQPDRPRWAFPFSKMITSLRLVLRPLHNLVNLYLVSSNSDRASVRNWPIHPKATVEGVTINDFRRKLSMLVESLNVLLSCVIHAEIARARNVVESEECHVLSKVTKAVLHKWDRDIASDMDGPVERNAQTATPAGNVADNAKGHLVQQLESESPGFTLQVPDITPLIGYPGYNTRALPQAQH